MPSWYYQPNKSRITYCTISHKQLNSHLKQRNLHQVVSLNRHRCFHVTYVAMKRACSIHRIDEGIADWIMVMLTSRIVSVFFGDSSISIVTTKRCPQCGVLPPLLWLLVVNEILNKKLTKITSKLKASPTTILGGFNVNVLCGLLQTVVNLVSEWCDNNELCIDPNKTTMILFTRRTRNIY